MRKTFALLLILVLLLGSFPALAVSPTDLNALARYYPADTPIFASVRIDDDYIATLDSVLDRFTSAFPDEFPPTSLTDMLDEVAQEIYPGGSFAENVRPWLGDVASLGIIDMSPEAMSSDDPPILIAIAITDRAAVEALLTEMAADADVEQVTEADYTIFRETGEFADPVAIIVRDDVLLFTNASDVLPAGGMPDGALAGSDTFTASLAALPEPDYNITLYFDSATFVNAALAMEPEMQDMMSTLGPLMNVVGQQVFGFTILDGVSMTMDIAQVLGDTSAFEELGIPMALEPLDPAFAARIPAGTALAIHGSDLKTTFESAAMGAQLSLEAQANMMDEMGGDMGAFEDMTEGLEQAGQAFTMFTGLDFEEDVVSWMTGDYAVFLSPAAGVDFSSMGGLMGGFPLTFGVAIEVGDFAAASNTVDGLTRAITNLARSAASDDEEPVTVSSETIGGAEVTVVTITAPDLPWPVELLLGANEDVFALGTRDAVRAILAPDGGLPSDPAYLRALDFTLPDTVQFAWIGFDALLPLADLAGAFSFDEDTGAAQTKALRSALSLFASSTITGAMTEDNVSVARAVLTFPE